MRFPVYLAVSVANIYKLTSVSPVDNKWCSPWKLDNHVNHLNAFHFKLINEKDTEKYVRSLCTKTSSGHDGISTKLLKFQSPGLIKPLILIINQSLITGIFPEKLK